MTINRLRTIIALSATAALAACIPPSPEPSPAPSPEPAPLPAPQVPAPAPAPQPSPRFDNWLDAPQTPGDWFYRSGTATFGPPGTEGLLLLRCDRAAGSVAIVRSGGTAAAPITVRTETMDRAIEAAPAGGPLPAIEARLAAHDPLLDAMAFSRGRFAVEVAGLPALYVPAYPEVTRVIEDCR